MAGLGTQFDGAKDAGAKCGTTQDGFRYSTAEWGRHVGWGTVPENRKIETPVKPAKHSPQSP